MTTSGAKRPNPLTRAQRRAIRQIVNSVPILDDAAFRLHAEKQMLGGDRGLLEKCERAGGMVWGFPLTGVERRRTALVRLLTDASTRYMNNAAAGARYVNEGRAADRKKLEKLIAALESLLTNAPLRLALYLAAEILDGMKPRSMEELGCTVAKGEDEGAPLAEVNDGEVGKVFAMRYRRAAKHPGAWVRDDARRLIRIAQMVLVQPPYHRTRQNEDIDEFIREVGDGWTSATGRAAAAGKANERGAPGPFAQLMIALFKIVEPSGLVSEGAYVDRIQSALSRAPASALGLRSPVSGIPASK